MTGPTLAVELVGGPMCGMDWSAPIGDGLRTPDDLGRLGEEHGGRYVRTDRQVQIRRGGWRTAYDWEPPRTGQRRPCGIKRCEAAACPNRRSSK